MFVGSVRRGGNIEPLPCGGDLVADEMRTRDDLHGTSDRRNRDVRERLQPDRVSCVSERRSPTR